MDYVQKLEELLEEIAKEGASDLHISSGRPPTLRLDGRLIPLTKYGILSAEDTEGMSLALRDPEQKKFLFEHKEIDLSYTYRDKARFRVNVYFQSKNI